MVVQSTSIQAVGNGCSESRQNSNRESLARNPSLPLQRIRSVLRLAILNVGQVEPSRIARLHIPNFIGLEPPQGISVASESSTRMRLKSQVLKHHHCFRVVDLQALATGIGDELLEIDFDEKLLAHDPDLPSEFT
jgi:hypothetical protein